MVLINRKVHPLNEWVVYLAASGINVLTGDFLFPGYAMGLSRFLVNLRLFVG